MSRTLASSIAGACVGFFTGFVGVIVIVGTEPTSDIRPIVVFLGSFLAGAGAIAGAVIGGVADLRESCKKRDQSSDREAS